MYKIDLSKEALKQIIQIRKSAPKLHKKIHLIIEELRDHPYTGTGHPEQLKYIQGMWSRRLDKKNRICYVVDEDIVTVYVISAQGHYSDK